MSEPFEKGLYVLLNYGYDLWHQRLVLAHAIGVDYIVAMPDFERW